jgi:hypothetical protein
MKLLTNNERRISNIVALLFGMFFCLNFYFNFTRVNDSGFVDLRNRVVGTRLLKMGISPYFFKWNSSYPETLYDPFDKVGMKNNMTTSPPSVLFLMEPLAGLDYNSFCASWMIVHYVFFLLILLPLYAVFLDPRTRILLLLTGGILLVSGHWRDSLFKGQCHFFLPAILSIIVWVVSSGKKYRFIYAGLLFSLLAWIRPNSLVIIPFLLFWREMNIKQLLAGLTAGGIFLILMTLLLHQQYYWFDFYLTCKEWIKNNTSDANFKTYPFKIFLEGKDMATYKNPNAVVWDEEYHDIYNLVWSRYGISIKPIYLTASFLVMYVVALAVAWKKKFPSFPDALFAGMLLYWCVEMCTPVIKTSYYYLELFVVVYLLICKLKELTLFEKILLAGSFIFPFLKDFLMYLAVAELCTVCCVASYLIRTVVFRRYKNVSNEISTA